jgi:uncharacterized integral membrane protein
VEVLVVATSVAVVELVVFFKEQYCQQLELTQLLSELVALAWALHQVL